LMKLDKEKERLLRQLEVLRRHMKNVEEQMQSVKKGQKSP
jgi:chaperonin cofactor prefoldin